MCLEQEQQEHKPIKKNKKNKKIKKTTDWPQILNKPQKKPGSSILLSFRSGSIDHPITERDLGAKLFGTKIVRSIHISKLFEMLQPNLAKLLRHQNRWLRVQTARGFNDHHQGLQESPARTESYKESQAE